MSTSIERTAYPRFGEKQLFHNDWLKANFSISDEEIVMLQRRSSPEAICSYEKPKYS
tara:strand:- start:164 stop:334 length:171 start_codon:yes stop_codon:yes gene_type:complete